MSDAAGRLWHESPGAEMLVRLHSKDLKILRANRSCCELLGMEEAQLQKLGGLERFFNERSYARFRQFATGESRRHMIAELQSADGRKLDVRFLRGVSIEKDDEVIFCLQDLTEIQEDARALQAGYDEFIRITKELEDAMGLIEKQNHLLEQQRNTMKQELVIAHRVQEHMFRLDFKRFKRVTAAGYYEAMTDLGGDMWEFLETDQKFIGVLGDVMGHGVAASLISISIKNHFKSYFEQVDQKQWSLGELCGAINDDMLQVTDRRYFITAAMLAIDGNNQMEYLTAGHPPLLIVPKDPKQEIELPFTEQPMLGIFDKVRYESKTVQLQPGDRVLLYTDCLTETSNASGDVLSIERIAELIREHARDTPDKTVKEILRFRTQFSGSKELPDDLTLVCVEVPERVPPVDSPKNILTASSARP